MMLLNPYRFGAGGGGPLPHLYWRINVTATSSSHVTVAELVMRSTVGGADLCVGGTGSASAASNPVANAFDKNNNTAWGAFDNPVQWLRYQFPSTVAVSVVEITAENGGVAGVSASPRDFTIQFSDDGSTWTTAATITGQTGWTAGQKRTFTF